MRTSEEEVNIILGLSFLLSSRIGATTTIYWEIGFNFYFIEGVLISLDRLLVDSWSRGVECLEAS